MNITPPHYENWLEVVYHRKYLFDPAVVEPTFDETPDALIELITATLLRCGEDLLYFTEEEASLGLQYVFYNGCSDYVFAFASDAVPLDNRLDGIRAIKHLYTDCFEPRCVPVLGHLDEPGANPLNSFCYMLWDGSPIGWWGHHADADAFHPAIVEVMAYALTTCENPACLESALHGLGHLKSARPDLVVPIIETFLDTRSALSAEIIQYAKAAMTGCIL